MIFGGKLRKTEREKERTLSSPKKSLRSLIWCDANILSQKSMAGRQELYHDFASCRRGWTHLFFEQTLPYSLWTCTALYREEIGSLPFKDSLFCDQKRRGYHRDSNLQKHTYTSDLDSGPFCTSPYTLSREPQSLWRDLWNKVACLKGNADPHNRYPWRNGYHCLCSSLSISTSYATKSYEAHPDCRAHMGHPIE